MSNAVLSRPASAHLALVARAVSDLSSPAVLSVPCILLGVAASDVPGTWPFALLYFVCAIPAPLVYLLWLVKTGRVTDFHLPKRSDRTGPFLAALASALAGVGFLFYFGAPAAFVAPVVTAFAQTLVLFLITLAWQISVHTATTAAVVTFAILGLGGAAVLAAPLVPLVIWARLYLRRHTMAQCIAGAALGCAAFATLFALRGIVW
jgi:membrane-associated phospholipid phosphatase